jgi:predicted nuclease of predicted toxin-antitoxin system
MPDRLPPLHCDEDVSVVLAAMLRARGFTVTTARDSGQLGRSDEEQLTFAADAGSVLVTHNRIDFERLHHSWLDAGRPHSGIARRLGRLLVRLSAEDFADQLFYV